MTTLNELLHLLAGRFTEANLVFGHGTDNPWDEAVALSLGVLEWQDDAANLARAVPPSLLEQIEQLAQRRIDERVPVPLLLGRARFAGHEFAVSENVMIPRSPLAEFIGQGFSPWVQEPPEHVLDLCAGGGCIGISCALYWPSAKVVLSELDPVACELAQTNIKRHGLEGRVELVQGDLFERIERRFDLIVANPPYVPSADTAARDREFRHEPTAAFDGGVDGMELVDRLLRQVAFHLTEKGHLFVEVGQYRAELAARYPGLAFVWPDIAEGGEGVFLLAAQQLAEHTG